MSSSTIIDTDAFSVLGESGVIQGLSETSGLTITISDPERVLLRSRFVVKTRVSGSLHPLIILDGVFHFKFKYWCKVHHLRCPATTLE
jgi:hypothetical protein